MFYRVRASCLKYPSQYTWPKCHLHNHHNRYAKNIPSLLQKLPFSSFLLNSYPIDTHRSNTRISVPSIDLLQLALETLYSWASLLGLVYSLLLLQCCRYLLQRAFCSWMLIQRVVSSQLVSPSSRWRICGYSDFQLLLIKADYFSTSFYGHTLSFFFSSSRIPSHWEGSRQPKYLNSVKEFFEVIFRRWESLLLHITVHIWSWFSILALLVNGIPLSFGFAFPQYQWWQTPFTVLAEESWFAAVFVVPRVRSCAYIWQLFA